MGEDKMRCVLGNGLSIRFWIDLWCTVDTPLKLLFLCLFVLCNNPQASVSSIMGRLFSSPSSIFRRNLRSWEIDVLPALQATVPPFLPGTSRPDKVLWSLSRNDTCSGGEDTRKSDDSSGFGDGIWAKVGSEMLTMMSEMLLMMAIREMLMTMHVRANTVTTNDKSGANPAEMEQIPLRVGAELISNSELLRIRRLRLGEAGR